MASSLPYTEHLKSIVRYNPENYAEFLEWMEKEPRAKDSRANPFVYIVDSQIDNTLKFHRYWGPGEIGNRLDELQNAIRNPQPTDIQTRLVIVNTRQQHLSPDLIDVLGMAYDIEPQYFLSVVAECEQYRHHLPTYRHVVPIPQADADFIHLELVKPPGWADAHNHAWIKAMKLNQLGHPKNIVVVVLSTAADELATPRARTAVRPSETSRAPRRLVIENAPPLAFDGVSNIDAFLEELNVLSRQAVKLADNAPLNYVRPLIQGFEVMVGRAVHKLERSHQLWLLLEPAERTALEDDELSSKWRDERLCVENAAAMVREIRRYTKRKHTSSAPGTFTTHKEWPKESLTSIEFLLQEGRTLETHVRDQLGLHVGSLALEDSRKSIEESKRSIKQANAMGRITILAFFFVPFSLVTSFFGMNVKEISGSGSSLKTFLIVAGTFTAITLILWVVWLGANGAWEAVKRLKTIEQHRLQKNNFYREKGKLKIKAKKRDYLTLENLWRELRPRTWFRSPPTSPQIRRSGDVFVAHLEGEV